MLSFYIWMQVTEIFMLRFRLLLEADLLDALLLEADLLDICLLSEIIQNFKLGFCDLAGPN